MHTLTNKEKGIAIFDPDNPRSVYNLVPENMQNAMRLINVKYYQWKEKTLERHTSIDSLTHRLRISFWNEYYITQDNDMGQISLAKVTRGLCEIAYFNDVVIKDLPKLAWILRPFADYEKAMDEMLHLSMEEMRNILTMEMGPKDTALMREKIKIFALLDNRVKGAVIQKLQVQQETRNLHLHQNNRNPEPPKSLQEIEKEIKLLHSGSERALQSSKHLADAVTAASKGRKEVVEELVAPAIEVLEGE